MSKYVQVLCDTPDGVHACELQLPQDATIATALEAARPLLGEAAVAWDSESAVTGVFGKICPRQHVLADGDRVELYRALLVDPRGSRRARAAKTSAPRARGG